MNNQSVILELREQDTPDAFRIDNGNWETVLNQDVDINDGDSIMIQQTFLDTVAFPEGTIVIPNNLSLRFQNYIYNNKWCGEGLIGNPGANANHFGQYAADGPSSALLVQNANPYVLCTKISTGDLAGYSFAPTFQLAAVGNRSGFNAHYGDYTLTLEYQAVGQVGAERSYLNIQIPKLKNVKGVAFNFNINITYETNIDIKVSHPSAFKVNENGGKPSFPDSGQAATGNDAWHPTVFDGIYQLPAGQYTPKRLCTVINTQLQQNYGTGPNVADTRTSGGIWNTSQFFKTSDSQAINEGTNSGDIDTCTLMDMANEGKGYHYVATYRGGTLGAKNIWMGASQMVLSYDDDSQKFFWEYLHTPLYQSGEESVAIQYNNPATGTPVTTLVGESALVYSSGGIIFQSLTAFEGILGEASYNPVDFWDGTLKFNLAQLYGPRYSMSTAIVGAPFAGDIKPYWNYINTAQSQYPSDAAQAVGLTMTGGYIGNDNAIIKDGDLSKKGGLDDPQTIVPFWQASPIPYDGAADGAFIGAFNPIISSVSATHTVEAADKMFKTTDIRSHYLIELDAKFRNNFLTNETNYRTMSQVVGKFYSRGSFTQSGSGGFIYTHVGPSLKLSSFKVRILYPDKSLADDIGDDNTVYINITRNPNARQLELQQLESFVKEQKAIEQ